MLDNEPAAIPVNVSCTALVPWCPPSPPPPLHLGKIAGLEAITAGALLLKSFPPRRFVVDPWLREGETALIWAASGVGKTMLSLSMAMAMATGGSVGGWSAEKPSKVVYIDGEMHLQDVRDRVDMLKTTGAVTLGAPDLLDTNLVFFSRQAQPRDAVFFDLTTEEGRNSILRACDTLGAEVLILDNFTTLSEQLEDENAAHAFKKIQRFLLQTKQAGLTTILIHHARKDGNALRGSASIEVTFEVVLELRKPKIERMGAACFSPHFGKFRQKKGEQLLPRLWSLTEAGWEIDEEVDLDADNAALHCVRSLRFVSQTEVAVHLGLAKGTVSKHLATAVERKLISREDLKDCFAKARRLREEGVGDDLDTIEEEQASTDDY